MSLAGTGVTRITIGDAWYELRRFLGWYALEATSEAANIGITLPGGVVSSLAEAGGLAGLPPDTEIGLKLPGPEVTLRRLQNRICAWSHDVKLSEENIKHLSPVHVKAILAEIEKLEAAERGELEALEPDAPFVPASAT